MGMVDEGLSEYNANSLRLPRYDYTQSGAYFVTICTYARICFFGEIRDGKMVLNKYGDIVRSCWQEITEHFPDIIYAPFVVMPNHVHGIVIISKPLPENQAHVETRHAVSNISLPVSNISLPVSNFPTSGASRMEAFQKPVPNSLSTIIRSFKSAVTKKLNLLEEYLPVSVWQRNYYEHVIRDEDEFNKVADYINYNPIKWNIDKDNPVNIINKNKI